MHHRGEENASNCPSQLCSPDVLELAEIEKPTAKDDEVLIRVHATAVTPLDWHFLTGTPCIARILARLLKPKRRVLGINVAGRVEAVGANVKRFQPDNDRRYPLSDVSEAFRYYAKGHARGRVIINV